MKVVLTAAIFDLLHEGHIILLKKMKKEGCKVVVVLHDDESCYRIKGKLPIQDVWQRMKNLYLSELADEVLITKSIDPADQFKKVVSWYDDILFMRADDNKDFPGKWFIEKRGIPTKFAPYTKGVSSTEIKEHLCNLN